MNTAPTPAHRTPDTALTAPRSASPPLVRDVPRPVAPVDGRTRASRRARSIYRDLADACTLATGPVRDALLCDAVALVLDSEALAARSAAGERVDPDLRVRISGALARALERLGLTTAPPPVDPDPRARLRDHLAQHYGDAS